MKLKTLLRSTFLLATLAVVAFNSSAATRIWDGGGTNGLWEAAANWSNNVAVSNGDLLLFPGNAARLINTNRVSSGITNVAAIRFSSGGYTVFSGPLRLNAGLTNATVGSNTLNAVLRPATNQTWSVASRTSLTINSNISGLIPLTLTLDVGGAADLTLNGNLVGNLVSLDVVKRGSGRLHLNGTNSLVSDFEVTAGVLDVDGFLDASLTISSNAVLEGNGALAFRVFCSGEMRPGGTGTGALEFRTAGIPVFQPGGRLVVNINGLMPGVDYDQLRTISEFPLAGAELVVQFSPSFPFAFGQKFILINNSGSGPGFSTTFTNLPQNTLITNNGIIFQISYSGGNGNDVELSVVDTPFAPTGVTRVWNGGAGAGNGGWISSGNWDSNIRPDQGDDLVFPGSAPLNRRITTNNLAATRTEFNRLWFGGGEIVPWIVEGTAFKLLNGLVATNVLQRGLVKLRPAAIELLGSQTWSATNVLLNVAAPVLLNGHTLTMELLTENSAIFESGLLGPGTLLVRNGFIDMSPGTAVSNVTVRIEGGNFSVQDVQATGPEWEMIGGTLGLGFARIPGLHASGGRLNSVDGHHVEIAGDLTLGPGCIVQALFGSESDQPFAVSGQVNLNGAQLEAGPTTLSLLGVTIKLIDNLGTNAVNGTFDGLPEGAVLATTDDDAGLTFSSRISYVGGDGNDVTLTVLSGAPRFTSVERLANGDVLLQGIGVAGAQVKVEASVDLTNYSLIGTVVVDGSGQYSFIDHTGALSNRFYRAFTP